MVGDDGRGDRVTPLSDPLQRKPEKRREVVSVPAGCRQRRQVLLLAVIVIVGQADHHHIVDCGPTQQKRLQRSGGAAIAVAEGVHGADMVVGSHGLDNGIVPLELSGYGRAESAEGGAAAMTAFNPSAARRPEGNVPAVRTQAAGLAPVIVAAGHDMPVNVQDELRGYWLLRGKQAQPAVGGVSGPQLPLGTGQIGTLERIGSQSFFLFALGELGAFDARGAGRFQAQLLFVDLLDPSRQVRHPI